MARKRKHQREWVRRIYASGRCSYTYSRSGSSFEFDTVRYGAWHLVGGHGQTVVTRCGRTLPILRVEAGSPKRAKRCRTCVRILRGDSQ